MEGRSCFYKSRLCKVIFQVFVLLGFIWLLLVGVVDSRTTKMMPRLTAQVAGLRRVDVIIGQRRTDKVHKELELNFVSKRGVPNGSDPIHNRRARNSKQPPGRAQRVGEAAIKGRRQ